MAELGIAMAAARREMLTLLAALIARSGETPFPSPTLSLVGFLAEDDTRPYAELEEAYAENSAIAAIAMLPPDAHFMVLTAPIFWCATGRRTWKRSVARPESRRRFWLG